MKLINKEKRVIDNSLVPMLWGSIITILAVGFFVIKYHKNTILLHLWADLNAYMMLGFCIIAYSIFHIIVFYSKKFLNHEKIVKDYKYPYWFVYLWKIQLFFFGLSIGSFFWLFILMGLAARK